MTLTSDLEVKVHISPSLKQSRNKEYQTPNSETSPKFYKAIPHDKDQIIAYLILYVKHECLIASS